ncbi:uncharacterized protein LOC133527343 isoform X2 [Cydia pomonella]|uniref:uncharacterized protein LOC133527343 isoform X2 n=1 Tax=Cydia pomonella TaxID=82600 RepID=UPI002ADE27CE|nr:uncharacterized protein LOC133527343 isoform X2 [Cydia pomonella]
MYKILLLAAIAMASAQGVNVVDNNPGPGQVNVVEQPGDAVKTVGQPNQGVDSAFYRPSTGGDNIVISNPDPGFYLGGANTGDPTPPSTIIENPDPGFYLPSNNAVQTPSIDPAFVVDPAFYRPSVSQDIDPAFSRPTVYGNLRPQKYPNPAARTGQ